VSQGPLLSLLHASAYKRVLAITLAAIVLAGGGLFGPRLVHHFLRHPSATSHALTSAQLSVLTQVTPAPATPDPLPSASATPVVPRGSGLLQVPYTVQAPFNDWRVFENACEEAALLMYHDFLQGDLRQVIPPSEAASQLRAMEQWQVVPWGADRDLDMQHTGLLAQQYYGYSFQVLPATRENIEASIDAGHPVIVPAMTHSLLNPYYGAHTVYHEVLIKGYNGNGVVTNDAGVMQGRNWLYSWSVLFSAIDAQTPKMHEGRQMLVVFKSS